MKRTTTKKYCDSFITIRMEFKFSVGICTEQMDRGVIWNAFKIDVRTRDPSIE